jgi:hypothetical protein
VRHRTPWYESENPSTVARGAGWRLFVIVACAIAAIGLLGAIGWGISVALSGPKGAGDVHRQNNDVTNRVFAQQHFEDLYAEITADDQKLDQAAADKAAHPTDDFARTNYTGLVNQCIATRAQYNADAAKVLQRDWLSTDLPRQIDPNDPKTDCKETAK